MIVPSLSGSLVNATGFLGFSNVAGTLSALVTTCVINPAVSGHGISTGEGATLVLAIAAYGSYNYGTTPYAPIQLASVTDSAGNAWQYAAYTSSSQNPPATGIQDTVASEYHAYVFCAIAYCINARPVSGSITVTITNPAYYLECDLFEFDQVPYGAAVSGAAAASATGGGLVTTYTTPSITVNQGDLVVAVSNALNGWATTNSPFTICPQNNGSSADGCMSAYYADATAGSVSCTFTGPYTDGGLPGGTSQACDGACILSIGGAGAATLAPGLQRLWSSCHASALGRLTPAGATGTLGQEFTVSQTCWMTAYWLFLPAGTTSQFHCRPSSRCTR